MEAWLLRQCDLVGAQIRAAVAGMSAKSWDARPLETDKTPREAIAHLCDVYRYVALKAEGQHPEWNGYLGEGSLEDFEQLRARAIEACLASEMPFELLTDYIILHDAYHVGQLCHIRRHCEPDWDAYAIYAQ